jgi:hypothetical protein
MTMEQDELKQMAVVVATAVAACAPTREKPEMPPSIKWAGGIISALLVMAIGGSGAWLINTVNSIQGTVIALDERSKGDIALRQQRDADQDRRLNAIESRYTNRQQQYESPYSGGSGQ